MAELTSGIVPKELFEEKITLRLNAEFCELDFNNIGRKYSSTNGNKQKNKINGISNLNLRAYF